MVPIARLNLLSERLRFAAAVGGISFAVALILLIQALYAGYKQSIGAFIGNLDAAVWVGQSGAFDLYRSTSVIPITLAGQISAMDSVEGTGMLRARQYSFDVEGREVQSLFIAVAGSGDSSIGEALGVSQLPEPGQIYISDHVKKASGLDDGDTVTIAGIPVVVAGSVGVKSPPFGSFSVLNFDDAATIFDMPDSVSYLLVAPVDGADAQAVVDEIRGSTTGVTAYTKSEFEQSNARSINEFLPVIGVLLVVSYFVGIAIASLTIYTATIEKTRDYGILKAIGSSNRRIYQIVIAQSFIVCMLGFLLALPIAFVVSQFAEARVAGFLTHFQVVSAVVAFASVLSMAVLSALLPARRIATIDPAIVFRA